jgi:hypothetical protein
MAACAAYSVCHKLEDVLDSGYCRKRDYSHRQDDSHFSIMSLASRIMPKVANIAGPPRRERLLPVERYHRKQCDMCDKYDIRVP